ncbi:hypothetical protein ABZ614_40085 [Streptomyces sp. NPDC013178]|uniref:hypothetical protein n=1 Tax=Streptomyces sp. NPDC013178 TaxID=3155118 RepID=UPI0033FE3F93
MPGKGHTLKTASSRELPTYRMVATDQIAIAYTIGLLPQPFSVHDVGAKLGVNAGRVGLTMAFFEYCGLVRDAPGKGMYLATRSATEVAEAWAKDAQAGKAALRKAWNQTWFTKSARNRLAQGAGLRDGLHARFMVLAGGEPHRRSVDKLIEMMLLSGLLIEEPDGFVRWHEESAPRPPREPSSRRRGADQPGQDAPTGTPRNGSTSHLVDEGDVREEDHAAEQSLDAEEAVQTPPSEEFPARAGAADAHTAPSYEDDPAELLTDPLWFKYVRHMSPDDAAKLHEQLHGVLSILARTRASARADTDAPAVELDQPLHLSDLGRVSLKTWLTVYASSREMSTFIPSMRSRQSTSQS